MVMQQLLTDLETLKTKYIKHVSTEGRLVLRHKSTNSSERAQKLKLKYKRMKNVCCLTTH